MRLYRIRHKKSRQYFVGGKGQHFFTRKNYAVLSFDNTFKNLKASNITFENQDEWEMVEFRLQEVRGPQKNPKNRS